jgi:hypothetical protein
LPNKKRVRGVIRTLCSRFLLYSFIISIPTCLPDNFSDFILLANSMTYAENRRNRGLTRSCKIERWWVSKLCWWGGPAWPTPMRSTRLGGFERYGDLSPTNRLEPCLSRVLRFHRVQSRQSENRWRLDRPHCRGDCCNIPCLVDPATLCAVVPAAMVATTKSVDTPAPEFLSVIGMFRQLRISGFRFANQPLATSQKLVS